MSGASIIYDINDKDINLRVLKSSYRILKDIALDQELSVKYMLEDIIVDYLKRRHSTKSIKRRNKKFNH